MIYLVSNHLNVEWGEHEGRGMKRGMEEGRGYGSGKVGMTSAARGGDREVAVRGGMIGWGAGCPPPWTGLNGRTESSVDGRGGDARVRHAGASSVAWVREEESTKAWWAEGGRAHNPFQKGTGHRDGAGWLHLGRGQRLHHATYFDTFVLWFQV